MTPPIDTHLLLDQIDDYIRESRQLLERGEVLQLSGLDQKIAFLCEETLKLSDTQRKQYAARFDTMLRELTELGHMLKQRREAVLGEIKASNAHRKAASAYRTAENTPPAGKDS
jgi:hypothetical protein